MKRLLVYGASEFGQVVRPLARECGFDVAGFIDDSSAGPDIVGSGSELLARFAPGDYAIAMAVGYKHLDARWKLFASLAGRGYEFPPLIHPRAIVGHAATIDEGSFVMAGSIVDTRARIGKLAVAWPGAIVNHDSRIGDNTFLGPGAIICGHVEIGTACFIGAGAVVVDHVEVPQATFIKAASRFSLKGSRA